tara:strand:+ start:362 stop:1927 length:1566 start_codon:yes stop_codon:yes gene_type:complete
MQYSDKTAKQRYNDMTEYREHYLNRGRECSELTLPALLPEDGVNHTSDLYTPYQSVGARGVNNLASKLLLLLLPPNQPFFRLNVDGKTKEEMDQEPEIKTEIEKSLAKIEREVMSEIEQLAIRVPVFEALKHLVITGNTLVYMPRKNTMRVFPLSQYVCRRDPEGNLLELVVKETVSPFTFDEKDQEEILKNEEDAQSTDEVDLYTHIYLLPNKKYYVCQEANDYKLPESVGTYTQENMPWQVLRMVRVDNEDYGRGYVEEYLGDLKSLEGLSQALVESAAASSKVVFMVRPNSSTKKRELSIANNGDIITGSKEDVSTLQVEKHYDLRVVAEAIERFEERLSFAFLLNSAVQRQAERVTAEEIRYMANELETALGGVYSLLSQEFQLPLVKILMQRMSSKGDIPKLPKGTVRPTIITGVEALGRGNDLQKLREFTAEIGQIAQMNPDVVKMLNLTDLIKRIATGHGIDTEGLIKSQDQLAAEQEAQQQQMQQQQLNDTMQQAAPQVAGKVADMVAQQQEM